MIKKIILTSSIFIASLSTAIATPSAPYFGFGTGIVTNTASNGGSYRGVPLNLLGGYGAVINQTFYLGGELFATLDTITVSNNNAGVNSLTSSYALGVSVMPGVLLADHTIGFARIGVVRARFANIGANSTGTQVGLGLQTGLIQNWDVRTEYDYSNYNKIHGIAPRSDAFNLAFIYKVE